MTPFLRYQHAKVSEVVLCDVVWVTHDLLCKRFMLLVQNFVNRTIVEIGITHTMDSHEVFHNTIAHGPGAFDFLVSKVKTSHL